MTMPLNCPMAESPRPAAIFVTPRKRLIAKVVGGVKR